MLETPSPPSELGVTSREKSVLGQPPLEVSWETPSEWLSLPVNSASLGNVTIGGVAKLHFPIWLGTSSGIIPLLPEKGVIIH